MMQTPGPIHRYVGVLTIELNGGADGTACGGLTEVEKFVEDRTVGAHVESLEVRGVIFDVLGRDGG